MKKPYRYPKIDKELQSEWIRRKPLYLEKNDDRYKRYVKQLKTNGFCDAETWGLDSVICQFILPRLHRFQQIHGGHPWGFTPEKWNAVLKEMVFAFEWSLHNEDDKYDNLTDAEKDWNWKRYESGMNLFAKWFRHLWW